MTTCTRRTRKNRPCRGTPVQWRDITALPHPAACFNHLTQEERAAFDVRRANEEAAWQRYINAEPICWRWSAPPVDLAPPQDLVAAAITALLPAPFEDPETEASLRLLHWQDGRCAICGHRRDLNEDHDHRTGLVRGYLCQSCNALEGAYGDGMPLLDRYRQRPPAAILGVTIRYLNPITSEYAQPQDGPDDADAWTDAASEGIGL